MTDIKFMDLSENDNPAPTDSVLIGNQQNGVKRTSLSKLGEMFAVKGMLHFEEVDQDLKAGTQTYTLTAPQVEGYTFIFWLQANTHGKSHSAYLEATRHQTTTAYITDTITASDEVGDSYYPHPSVGSTAVYVKSELL